MMIRRLVGGVMFLALALTLFEHSFRLASGAREGWFWFLLAGLILSGVVHATWVGEVGTTRCPYCRKPDSSRDLE
jgi:hypothetical protein